MLPPPQISTLFPYTTLFRSLAEHAELLVADRIVIVKGRVDHKEGDKTSLVVQSVEDFNPSADEIERAREKDRKSTRLNSSHSQISYAVFCLKKKKKKKNKTK